MFQKNKKTSGAFREYKVSLVEGKTDQSRLLTVKNPATKTCAVMDRGRVPVSE